MGKIVQIFFVKFKIFKYLKFNKKYFKKYIYCHKNPELFFPKSISNVSVNCQVSDSKVVQSERLKKEKLLERVKNRPARILMHKLTD
jgi:hypothetical protein